MHASVDDIQKYADDTRTTCRRHVTRGFCPKMGKKSLTTPKLLKKKFPTTVTQTEDFFFFSLSKNKNQKIRLAAHMEV
jgi:hypothetical protein